MRGAYSVQVISTHGSPDDFVVTGLGDIDGDGVYSRYTATRSLNARQVNGNDTY